jgi:hypothetical protein
LLSVRFSVESRGKKEEGISEKLCPDRGRKEIPSHVPLRGKANTEGIGGARV